jgi:hypothetical protein
MVDITSLYKKLENIADTRKVLPIIREYGDISARRNVRFHGDLFW